MLKKATIFKDFFISTNAGNTGVLFRQNSPLIIDVKNDNFARQVQILDNDNIADLFDYKYITFDNNAVFEITDCIKNGKYTTLFIQYLSNIIFNSIDANFRVDAVSSNTLQKLGLDINDFLKILGNNTTIATEEYATGAATQDPLLYVIKLRFSQIPQNLNYYFSGNANEVTRITTERNTGGTLIHNQSYLNRNNLSALSINDFTQFDNAVTVLLPIPIRGNIILNFNNGYGVFTFTMSAFINTLSALISDLTLTAELTILTKNSLAVISENSSSQITILDELTTQRIIIQAGAITNLTNTFFRTVKLPVTGDSPITATTDASLCILCECSKRRQSNSDIFNGVWEVFNYFRLQLSNFPDTRALLSISLLNNTLDISQLRNNYLLIKRQNQSLRVYIDYERNVYEDIQTTFEYAKDAYSNYDAFQKSNIELTNRQNAAALILQQKQQRDMQTVNSVATGFNTALGAAGSFAAGDIAGGVMNIVGGAANIAADEIKSNMRQQNDTANQNLTAAQAHERARSVIVPSSELHGSLSILNAFISMLAAQGKTSLYTLKFIDLNRMQMACLEKFVFDNVITDKITDISQIVKPLWQQYNNFFQVKIANRSALNNRKDFIIFAEI